ncbi:enoyl-CoA hydratase/carnithine racemase [Streptomyces achromogenes]|uniref:Enoyl-CoA hydratase/carnithine racemase n=1 Tax=Streptomyces achromogenes TaxID=67255 RepID=A0ABU0PV38_STRAH|nr:enoyl-CoA hydratase/isomerase family protein [Streptomyces achromogenes]MDQ0682021.1 enoyl-CoA hydratase/carnithine racemase [Streptomyces achromogenes]MDQ0829171.1 enoyl-CoA hydratase/carnithine racemase [Streptomyces achromogenes]
MEPPFLLVDLDGPASHPSRETSCVRVAVAAEPAETTGEFDLLLTVSPDPPRPWVGCADPYVTAQRLRDIVTTRPDACLALVQVLRMGPSLPPPDRLIMESLAYSTLQAGAAFRSWLAGKRPRAARPSTEPVLLDRDGDRLTITLNRPRVHNAFDAATRDALCEALEVAVSDPTVTRVDLRGNGPSFCSGGDLAEFGSSTDPARAHHVRVHRSPAALLQRCTAEVTAHLHGACVGAGIELAAFAGRVTVAPDTVIRLPEIDMGLIPGAGGTASLPTRIGRERTAYLALTGAALSATEARRWGLADETASGHADAGGALAIHSSEN